MTARARLPWPTDIDQRVDDALGPWLTAHAVAMLAAVGVTILHPSGAWLSIAAAWSFADLWYRGHARRLLVQRGGGYADRLTALRLGAVLICSAFVEMLPVAWLWALLAINVVIDVGDGYVARRRNEATAFGSVFDREVDAVFVLTVYQYFFLVLGFPAWVLIPGILPYAFRLATTVQANAPPPQHRERLAPLLAGANFVVLLSAVLLPSHIQPYAIAASMMLVGVSFLVSFAKLFGHEPSLP